MNIAILDTETTGLLLPMNTPLLKQPSIIEFYGCVINEEFELIREVNQLLAPPIPVLPEKITQITGITDDMLKGKPTFKEFYDDLNAFFDGVDIFVAHNAMFDKGMLENEIKRIERDDFNMPKHTLCTVEASIRLYGHRVSLTNLHWRLFQKQFSAHRAKDDVHALVRCFHKLTETGQIDLSVYK